MKMRVLQVCCTPAPGALPLAERLARWRTLGEIAEATASAGADVTVLLDGPAEEERHSAGVRYRQVPRLRWPAWHAPFTPRAAAIARQHAPDVIHMVGLDSPIVTRALCRTGIPVLAQDHASQPRGRSAPLWRWGHAHLAGAAFTAFAQAEPFLRNGEIASTTRIFAIAENSSRFTPGERDGARMLTGISGSPALLWVGHLNENKNPMLVLRAVQRVIPHVPGVALWCAFGDAPLRPEIEAMLAADPELRSRVHLLGTISHSQMEDLYRASDAFVSASRREGSGYALIEALACGLVPIVSDIPSFRSLTGNGAAGALVPVDDAEAMAAAIFREFAGRIQPDAGARHVVRDHFERNLSFEVIGARLVDAYATLAGGPRCG